ncbi:PQQ-binding-like beta-propeller repeat protein, partial [Thermoproteota archaeon]
MKISINKTKLTAIITITILVISAFVTLSTIIVQAQGVDEPVSGPLAPGITPDMTEATRAFLSFRPTTVGVNQPILVNMWLNPATHRMRYHPDYKIIFTKPDGSKDTVMLDSYEADTTGWFEYIPDQVGEWTVKFEFAGTYFPGGDVPGGFGEGPTVTLGSTYYEPSSTQEQPLTVQEEIVYSWPESPLPTDYWTRPISLENREWWPIAGGYPGTGYFGGGSVWDELYPDTNPRWSPLYDFHPWVQGPNTSHIVWKKQLATAGLIGGYAYHYGTTTRSVPNPDLVYAGRAYDTMTIPVNGVPTSCAVCYDLRTGEIFYAIPTSEGGVTPNIISYNPPGAGSVPGAVAQTTYAVELLSISGGNLRKVNADTGAVTERSIAPLTGSGGTYYTNQEVMTIQDLGADAGDERYRLIKWSTAGTSSNFASRVLSNTTYARSSWVSTEYVDSVEVAYRFHTYPHIDFNAGIGVTVGAYGWTGPTRVYEGFKLQAYDLETGVTLWDKDIDIPIYSRSCYVADHGKIAILTQNGYFLAYDLQTGNLAWQGETMDYPWASAGFGAYAIQSAYGMLFRQSYNGVYAFDWDDGSIVWHYEAPSLAVYESPYINAEGEGTYPFNGGALIADGKMYVYNTEHTASWPMTRGWGLHCIDITNGELVWKIANPMNFGAVADGYLTAANSWDGYQYVFGKGKSQTTVTAPDVAVPKGTAFTIKGTALDVSPAQPGTPCVSKESMSLQMEYLHLQRPIDGIWHDETITGVPVMLTALGEDGSYVDIGTVITDGYSGTFGKTWTPTTEGIYKIIASFEGDDSYGSSSATTWVTVGPAPSPGPQGEPGPTGATGPSGSQGA